jgi:hypothetical protein
MERQRAMLPVGCRCSGSCCGPHCTMAVRPAVRVPTQVTFSCFIQAQSALGTGDGD